jgi:hypothetical protein
MGSFYHFLFLPFCLTIQALQTYNISIESIQILESGDNYDEK